MADLQRYRHSDLPDDECAFRIALRQATGFVASLLRVVEIGWLVPDFTTLPWPSHIGDEPALSGTLNQIPQGEQIGSVTAGGADDRG